MKKKELKKLLKKLEKQQTNEVADRPLNEWLDVSKLEYKVVSLKSNKIEAAFAL